MSKFCMQCGKEIDDNADVCSFCGASQGSSGTEVSGADTAVKKSNSGMAVLIAAAAVVIVVLIVIFNLLFGGGYKQPVDDMMKAIETGKGKYMYRAMPEFLMDYQYEDEKKSEIYDELDDAMEYVTDMLEDQYGDDVKISYKVKDKKKIDKDDLEDLEESIKDTYDEKVRVSKGYELEIKTKIKGDDDSDTDTSTINVYKIDGDWCLMETIF